MAQRVSKFERKDGDEYMTPEWVWESMFSILPPYGRIWDPCCGEGAMGRVLRRIGGPFVEVVESDLDPRHSPDGKSWDFLDPKVLASYFTPSEGPFMIASNPPYGKRGRLAEAFVRAALTITGIRGGRVAMLLPVDWDSARGRKDLFEEFPGHLTRIVLTDRIRWTNLPQSENDPSTNHAIFCWDWSRRGVDWRWIGNLSKERAA